MTLWRIPAAKLLEKLSMGELSQTLSARLMLQVVPYSLSNS